MLEGCPSVKMLESAAHLCFLQVLDTTLYSVCEGHSLLTIEIQGQSSIETPIETLKHKYNKIFEDPVDLPLHS